MTTPDTPLPDPFPRELLAAYADGELDPAGCVMVERWLAAHPEALPEVQAQRDLSPSNVGLWVRTEPPEPSPVAWAVVRRGIADALTPTAPSASARGRWRVVAWALGGFATAGLAAAVAWVVLSPFALKPGGPVPVDDTAKGRTQVAPPPRAVPSEQPVLIEGFAVLPIASDDDVILERVPDLGSAGLPVGRHPLPGLMLLASAEEFELEEVAPSPLWPTGVPKMTTAPGDAPMIFAAKPR